MGHFAHYRKPTLPRFCAVATLFSILVCTPQTPLSPFERIENSRIRPIGMMILPYPEGAPGDTLYVSAYFAGKHLSTVNDFRICKGEFDTIGSPISVNPLNLALPDSIGFSYVLPGTMLDSIVNMAKSSANYSSQMNFLIEALRTDNLTVLSDLDSSTLAAAVGFLTALELTCRFMFTVKASDGEALKIRKDFMVRYNCRFQSVSALARRLPVNHNPALRFIALYKVQGDTSTFDPNDSRRSFSMNYLQTVIPGTFANDTMEIDTGYSYFLGTDTGIVSYRGNDGMTINDTDIDRTTILYTKTSQTAVSYDSIKDEYFSYKWFYEQHGGRASADNNDEMTLEQEQGKSIAKLHPPLDLSVSGCTIWVKIIDGLYSNAPRPTGISQSTVRCVFRYTDAYKKMKGE